MGLLHLIVVAIPALSLVQPFELQTSGVQVRLRGLSVVSDQVAWASGDKGSVLRTVNGGTTWTLSEVPDASDLDFRDVHALDASRAWVLSIGNGEKSRIYQTADGGKTWGLQYINHDPEVFLDAIAFWDEKHGIVLGDPVAGRYTILTTDDGGRHWTRHASTESPLAMMGEGAFAASGTCLIVEGERHVWFGTGGGRIARVFRSEDRGKTWSASNTKIAAGNPSSGIFSLAFKDARHGVAVGGDYKKENQNANTFATTDDGGLTWSQPLTPFLGGYRSAVVIVGASKLVAVGPTGADVSMDGGKTWKPFGKQGFHAVGSARGSGWAVGEKGLIGRFMQLEERVQPSK